MISKAGSFSCTVLLKLGKLGAAGVPPEHARVCLLNRDRRGGRGGSAGLQVLVSEVTVCRAHGRHVKRACSASGAIMLLKLFTCCYWCWICIHKKE